MVTLIATGRRVILVTKTTGYYGYWLLMVTTVSQNTNLSLKEEAQKIFSRRGY